MRVLTLSEIMALEFGEIVPAFRAQIKQVYPQKSDTNEYGPWSIQRVLLMDGAALMTAKLFPSLDRENVASSAIESPVRSAT